MKALTIHQPHAWLIVAGHKTVENRRQRTSYRGAIAIHAGARAGAERLGYLDGIDELRLRGYDVPDVDDLAFGAVVGIAEVVDCLDVGRYEGVPLISLTAEERKIVWRVLYTPFGKGPFCWMLTHARALDEPIPCSGKEGLWTLDDALLPESFRAK